MTAKNRIELRISEVRSSLREIAEADALTPESRENLSSLKSELKDLESQLQAIILSMDSSDSSEEEKNKEKDMKSSSSSEDREIAHLVSRSKVGKYLYSFESGRLDGAEAELNAALGSPPGSIPFELFDDLIPEERAVTPAPTTGVIQFPSIVPAVFAKSVAQKLMISMPRVKSGSYGITRITTNQSTSWQAVEGEQSATAGAMTVTSTSPHRISAKLEITEEAVASVGLGDFESSLKMNLSAVLSDALDTALLRGSGASNQPSGLITQLTAPTAETTTDSFTTILRKVADELDGVYSEGFADIGMLVNPDTIQRFETLFSASSEGVLPRETIGTYLMNKLKMLSANYRMPATASNVATALICKHGFMGSNEAAVMPTWGSIQISDIYSDAASAQRNYIMHVLCGDVLLKFPSAYVLKSFLLA